MSYIEWQPSSSSLSQALSTAGVLRPFAEKLLAELDRAGDTYEASGHFVRKTTVVYVETTGPIASANLKVVDEITREGLNHFGISLAANNLGPWTAGETNPAILGGRLTVLNVVASEANDALWLDLIAEGSTLLQPPVTLVPTQVTTVTGNASPESAAALSAALSSVDQFLAVLTS